MIYNQDCMEAMKEMTDKQFDLAIVDPPYMENIDEYLGMQKRLNFSKGIANTQYKNTNTFGKPNDQYFNELFRVSKNQIIWGINHFKNFGKGRIIWDKQVSGIYNHCELAYHSFGNKVTLYTLRWNGMLQHDMKNKEIRIHPTQKPVKLYEWLLINYAKENDKILDTHLGSGSIAIACHNLGYDLTGYEIDKEYFEAAQKRVKEHQSQLRIL